MMPMSTIESVLGSFVGLDMIKSHIFYFLLIRFYMDCGIPSLQVQDEKIFTTSGNQKHYVGHVNLSGQNWQNPEIRIIEMHSIKLTHMARLQI